MHVRVVARSANLVRYPRFHFSPTSQIESLNYYRQYLVELGIFSNI